MPFLITVRYSYCVLFLCTTTAPPAIPPSLFVGTVRWLQDTGLGILAALAYPDRVGLRRKGEAPRYVLSGGKGAVLPETDPMAGARLIVATDLDGDPREARIRQAVEISDAELRATFPEQIHWQDVCEWSRREGRVLTPRQEVFGALVLEELSLINI